MPLATDPIPVPVMSVEPWADPVVDELGHDPRSAYAERFWLPVLGPSTVWFLRRLADRLDDEPDGFELDLVDTARCLGLGMKGGRNAPIMRTVERCCRFGAARLHGHTGLSVRRRLAPLNRAQVERLPEALQAEHVRWLARPTDRAGVEEMRERARRLALSLLELGEVPEACERQLHQWRFHPAVAFEAVRWAREAHAAIAAGGDEPPARPRPVPVPPAVRAVAARATQLSSRIAAPPPDRPSGGAVPTAAPTPGPRSMRPAPPETDPPRSPAGDGPSASPPPLSDAGGVA